MIKALQLAAKTPLGKYALTTNYKYCTIQNGNNPLEDQAKKPNKRFNGFMLPVVYPIWISSGIRINLAPKISEFIKTNSLQQVALLAYAPEVKQVSNQTPLENQFYHQATLCNLTHLKKNQYALDPIKKIRVENISKQLQQIQQKQHYDIPELKLPNVKLNYKLPNQIKTTVQFDENGNVIPEQELLVKKMNNVIYKLEGQILQSPEFPKGIINDVRYKMLMQFAFLSSQKMNEGWSPLFKNQVINLSQVAQKTISLIQPYIFAAMFKQKDLFPRLPYMIQDVFQTQSIEQRMEKDISLLYDFIVMVSLLQQAVGIVNKDQNKKSMQMQAYQLSQVIRGALDGNIGKQGFVDRIKKQFMQNNPPQQIIKAFNDECNKYMEEEDVFSGNTKDYIQTLSSIPYNVQSEEIFDIQKAKQILDRKHYGMEEVKKYILEFIAVGKLKKSQKGKVLCFIGPPGVGKTTFAQSVAQALGRKFESISLGGVIDSSTLKGHRRTYINSFSGKIIQALRRCNSSNPVILLDQIDKMGASGYNGDPRSDLLQILDPNQNSSFVDNYVDHPVDLSNVLFICSANYLHGISRPLLDRLQKIQLSSYTDDQKIQIANKHILPKAIKESGLQESDFTLQEGIIKAIIEKYTYGQPGVRYLEKLIKKIFQKIAVRIVDNEQKPILVSVDNLDKFLDHPDKKKIDYNSLGIGVAIGLGQSQEQGGRITIIQVVQRSFKQDNRRQGLLKTGNLGEVLKESVDISYTFAKRFLKQKFNNTFLYENQIHLHAPEGHSKKNGAGQSLTIATALVSIALKKIPKRGIAVAGELSLKGKIIYIHELKQKLLAAKRQGIYELVIPRQNKQQVQKMPEVVTGGLSIHYVQQFEEVQKIMFQ